jgi:hypothetical protein
MLVEYSIEIAAGNPRNNGQIAEPWRGTRLKNIAPARRGG